MKWSKDSSGNIFLKFGIYTKIMYGKPQRLVLGLVKYYATDNIRLISTNAYVKECPKKDIPENIRKQFQEYVEDPFFDIEVKKYIMENTLEKV